MNVHTMKIAVSLPAETLRSVETTRQRLGRSRSSVVAEALEAWLQSRATATEDARYLEAYARCPEPAEGETPTTVTMETWDDWDSPAATPNPSKTRNHDKYSRKAQS